MNCYKCGKEIRPGSSFCEYCGAPVTETPPAVSATPEYDTPAVPQKQENFLMGLIGALVGAIIGGAAIIAISMTGYVAAISGLVLAFCTLKGYELLGKKLSIKGIVVCVVLMLATPYIADTIGWVIAIMNAYADYGITVGEAFSLFPLMLEDGAIVMEDYIQNLLMLYGFTALGAVGTVINTIKNAKNG